MSPPWVAGVLKKSDKEDCCTVGVAGWGAQVLKEKQRGRGDGKMRKEGRKRCYPPR